MTKPMLVAALLALFVSGLSDSGARRIVNNTSPAGGCTHSPSAVASGGRQTTPASDARRFSTAARLAFGTGLNFVQNRLAVDAGDAVEADAIRDAARSVLARDEFRRVREQAGKVVSPLDSADLPDQQRSKSDEESSGINLPQLPGAELIGGLFGVIIHGIAWIVIAAVCGAIVFLIVQTLMGIERRPRTLADQGAALRLEELSIDAAPGETDADEFVDRARRLASDGQFRDAVAQLLLGAMSNIERSGRLRFRRGLTLRDYLRCVRSDAPLHQAFGCMIELYEPLGFGRRAATSAHFEQSLSWYEVAFHAAPV